jgi:methionyl-tRNA formyltransferase
MGKKMDAGNVLLQIDQQVKLTTNIIELAKQMGELGASTWAIATCLHIYHQIYPQYQFSITQDDQNVSICNILKKEDRIVELAQKSAFEVYNHFRAYQNFPGTSFYSKYFKQEIKILEIDLETVQKHAKEYNLEIDQLLNNSGILEQKTTFADFFKQKNQVYLICKDQTLLPIKSVQLLENNQKITLAGYNFKR